MDILIAADDAVTVGLVAEHLARCEFSGLPNPSGTDRESPPMTLRVLAPGAVAWVLLWSRDSLHEARLTSGVTIEVIPIGHHAAGDVYCRKPAAFLRCVSGPQSGQLFPLDFGENVVGRGATSDVIITDPEVSRAHCVIEIPTGSPPGPRWSVQDIESSNGTTLDHSVAAGPVVRLGQTSFVIQPADEVWNGAVSPLVSPSFVRSPRLCEVGGPRRATMPRPPQQTEKSRPPILAMCAPLGMGAMMAVTMKSTMGLMFLVMSPLVMVAHHFDTSFSGKKRQRSDAVKFERDLARVTEQLREARTRERAERLGASPSVLDVTSAIWERHSLLWSRRPGAQNFTEVRFGTGTIKSSMQIEMGAAEGSDSKTQSEIRALAREYDDISAVPITSKLTDSGSFGIVGAPQDSCEFATAIILQLVGLHTPSDLHLRVLGGVEHADAWSWVKWLPHVTAGSTAMAGTPAAEQMLQELEEMIARRSASPQFQVEGAPRKRTTVVVVLSTDGTDRARLAALAEDGAAHQIHLIWIAEELNELPAACRTYVQVGLQPHVGYTDAGHEVSLATIEGIDPASAMRISRQISGIVDADALDFESHEIPATVTLREVMELDPVGKSELVVEAWARPGASELAAVVGQGKDGPVVLSLRAHGPHALVGGTTGAGKSEFLQTWLMSLAVEHSPDQVNFLLVDYKGGAAFAECVQLPHTVGLVTDLSLAMVHRVLKSLRAELRYREHFLNDAGVKDLIELERLGSREKPPALVIVVDEFAALVADVPEFVDGMVDIAQRGRSLGLHLILATQRPAGVIRDNLRANTNLRIALRMADATDSQDVVGVRDAADFDPTLPGRALMSIGTGAPVEFQSGYLGGVSTGTRLPAIQVSELPFLADRYVSGISPQVRSDVHPDHNTLISNKRRDIERLLITIQEAAKRGGYALPRVPWLPPLPNLIDGAALPDQAPEGSAALALGLLDEPDTQRQTVAKFDPDGHGHLLVLGTSGSGKTTALRTAVLAASAQSWQIYVVDAAGGALADLVELPTVGAVIRSDDAERVDRLFTLLQGELLLREQLGTCEGRPRMMVVIDGFGVFRETYERDWAAGYMESLGRILAVGRQLGIHVAVAAERVGAVPSSLASGFQARIVLRLGASSEYLNADVDEVLFAGALAGRGAMNQGEVQIAVWGSDGSQVDQRAATKQLGDRLRALGTPRAPSVRSLPDFVRWEEIEGLEVAEQRSPVGIQFDSLDVATVPSGGLIVVAGGQGSGRTQAIRTLLKSCANVHSILLAPQRDSDLADSYEWSHVAIGADRVNASLAELAQTLGVDRGSASSYSFESFETGSGIPPEVGPSIGSAGEATEVNATMPGLIVIESSAEFDSAERLLGLVLRAARRHGIRVIVEVDVATASSAWTVHTELKGAAAGIFLQPDDSDAISLFRVAFPRGNASDFPVGRGYLVERGRCTKVQIATVD